MSGKVKHCERLEKKSLQGVKQKEQTLQSYCNQSQDCNILAKRKNQ